MRTAAWCLSLFAALVATACAYSREEFAADIATEVLECYNECYPMDGCFYSYCHAALYPDETNNPYRCAFHPREAHRCVRAWKRRDCTPPCEGVPGWDDLPECQEVYACDDRADTGP